MNTDLKREEIMMIVERARYQRSIAAGEVTAVSLRKSLAWLAKWTDRFLHALLMSPTANH
ncbi:MAG TPA: hypothetical protein PLL14_00980 [Accumulibacter sp.]|nr:hypothetical protein [Accumulibacter sp.]